MTVKVEVSEAEEATPAVDAEGEGDDDEMDLFGDDDEDDESSFDALCKAKQAAIDKANSKAKPTAKSIILWEVKPLESETNLDDLAKRIMSEI
jgi:elongation factor 1-beta